MKVRDKLIYTAARLFHQQGYNSTGINQIIDEAGIAKGSFYYNFKSKEELCIAYLEFRHEHWFTKLKQYVKKHASDTSEILCAFDFLIFMNELENFRGCSFLNILAELNKGDEKILKVIQSHKNDLRTYFNDRINDATVGDHMYLLFESALIESQLFKDQWPIIKSKNIVQSLIN
ncbi:TetR/AcrR family transcriptional regulator [Fulvivirga ulvae]|uniref:TetR/AcrR family transcriptional regulator n=1 Tax=Fulvivirga ulvae TaxID=2904245 RepID=UPI001F37D4FB|nr:TetR/AcrR family transcriptional regulator [Fulvivirga ulvae]UII33985.1 TetR/AcrR family transcriptional regulator [Fulvivirga ulvae]